MNQTSVNMRKLLELSELVKDSSPDSRDVIDKTVGAIQARLSAVTESRKQKTAQLDALKIQWSVKSEVSDPFSLLICFHT